MPGQEPLPEAVLHRLAGQDPGHLPRPATSDFSRDGFADPVAGTPRANSLTVVPGGGDGPPTSARRTLAQSSTGVLGSSESGDGFGASTAWGAVNGDGCTDLASPARTSPATV